MRLHVNKVVLHCSSSMPQKSGKCCQPDSKNVACKAEKKVLQTFARPEVFRLKTQMLFCCIKQATAESACEQSYSWSNGTRPSCCTAV